jgi:PKD repeat protein/sugar lactone lactonase YvrE
VFPITRRLVVAAACALLCAAPMSPTAARAATPARAGTVSGSSVITTVAGTGASAFGGDGGPAVAAQLNQPRDSDVGPDGSIYVADTMNSRVRRIAPDGTISTFAGTGSRTYNGDGIPATQASLSWPHDVFVDPTGVVYVADANHHRVRRVDLDGTIHTVAGTGVAGSSGDGGLAVDAQIKNPKSMVLHDGVLYFSDLENKIRQVDLGTGIISTFAGNGSAGYSGDGGPATSAELNDPQRIQVDSAGDLYIADALNNVVRRVDGATHVITTVAGTGRAGLSGDGGQATAAQLSQPRGVALAGDSLLYVADTDNHRVRAVDLSTGLISTVVGTTAGFSGDGGPAVQAQLDQPRGLTVLPDGDLLVADTLNSRLRLVSASATAPVNQPPVASFTSGCTGLVCTFDATASHDPDGSIASYAWDFGDGGSAGGSTSSHTYGASGQYPVTLTVTDDQGATAHVTHSVGVQAAGSPGAIAFDGAVTKAGASAQPTVKTPTTVKAGDELVLTVTLNSASPTVSSPAGTTGWVRLGTTSTPSMTTVTWTKTAGAADHGHAVHVLLSASAKFTMTMGAYSGTTSSPVFVGGADTVNHAARTTPTLNAPDGAWLLSYWADRSSTTTAWAVPAGQTTRGKACTSGSNRVCSVMTDSAGLVPQGIAGGVTATTNKPSASATTWSIALR